MAAMALLVAIASCLVSAQTASAGTVQLGTGWTLWSKSYCEQGRLVDWRRLQFHTDSGSVLHQGRQYVYARNGRLCTFVVDHAAGSHEMSISAKRKIAKTWHNNNSGYYSQYAGVLAAPGRVQCITVGSELTINRKVYQQSPKNFCK